MLSASGRQSVPEERCLLWSQPCPPNSQILLCLWLQTGEYQNWGNGSPEEAKDISPVNVFLIKQCYSNHNGWDAPPALVLLVSNIEIFVG